MRKLFITALVFGLVLSANAQSKLKASLGSCGTTSPCVQLNWTNQGFASTVSNNSSGVEIAGPGTSVVLRCTGTSTVCTAASAPVQTAAGISAGTYVTNSLWSVIFTQNSTTNTGGPVMDTAVAFNTSYTYTVFNYWTGTGGGVPSGYSNFLTLSIGQAPQAAPPAPSGLGGSVN